MPLPELLNRTVSVGEPPPPNGHDAIKAAIDQVQPVGFSAIEIWCTHFPGQGDNLETRMEGRWIGVIANNPAAIVQCLRAQADIVEKQFGLKPGIEIARILPNGR